ncbi:MAG: hypothetical protein ACE5J1_05480, partial [Nitrospiria bacterium]
PYLDCDLQAIIEQEIFKIALRYEGKHAYFRSSSPVAYLVRRPRFDACLLDQAKAAGADVREGCPMLDWREVSDGVEVQTHSGKETGSFMIAADGAISRVARRIYPHWRRNFAFSIEQVVPFDGSDSGVERPAQKPFDGVGGGEVLIDLAVARGYGWIFPKRSEAAIGIAGLKGKGERPNAAYSGFLNRHDILSSAGAPPSGCVIPLYHRTSPPLARGRVLLVGDAAALVDPLFGEGIYYAFRSGQMAAKAVIGALAERTPIHSYDREIRSIFYPDLELAWRTANWIYAFPGFFLEAVRRHPGAMELYFGIFRGERSYVDFWKEVRKAFFRQWNPLRRFSEASSRP